MYCVREKIRFNWNRKGLHAMAFSLLFILVRFRFEGKCLEAKIPLLPSDIVVQASQAVLIVRTDWAQIVPVTKKLLWNALIFVKSLFVGRS